MLSIDPVHQALAESLDTPCAFFTYGGPIRSVHALCRELAAAGHDVQVFTTSVDGPGNSDVPHGVPVDVEGVTVTYFPSRVLRRLYWSPPMGRALSQVTAGYDA
eukprot:gene6538-8320_t